jgi:alpha-beta hydrolase superfamily lysophospholipase
LQKTKGRLILPPFGFFKLPAMETPSKIDRPDILSLLFQPPADYIGNCPAQAEDVPLSIAEGVSLSCRFYSVALDAPTLIYYHGGCDSSDTIDTEAEALNQCGINVFLASYRGFGKSTGSPAFSSLLTDADMLFSLATEWLTGKGCSGPLFVMGRALGSVCVLEVVHANPQLVKGMVLESGYGETIATLQALGADTAELNLSEEEGFNNVEKIANIKVPTLIFHGSRDGLVPVAQAEKLQAASGARNKQFVVVPGATHDTVSQTGGPLYFKTIQGFIETACGINTWRQRRKRFKAGRPGDNE